MLPRIQTWIESPADYDAFKLLMPNNPDFPDTYNVWLNLAAQQIAQIERAGHVVEKVTVNPNEFARYCDRAGLDRNTTTLDAFSIAKWRGNGNT